MSFILTDEQRALCDTVRKITSEFGFPYWAEKARTGGKTDELWTALGRVGFLGTNIPEEFGGAGAGISELALVCEEVAAAGCPLLMMVVSPAICGAIIAAHGSTPLKQRWLPGLATGEIKMAFAITEPDAGSNSHNIATTATRSGDVYRLRGSKTFISGVDEAQAMLVVARTATDQQTGRGRLSLFVVETDRPGLDKSLIPVEIFAPEKQFLLHFDDLQIPAENLVGIEHEGLRTVFDGLNPERIMGAAISLGIGRYALKKASAYARERVVWDVPIGAHQGIAHPLAEAKIHLELASLMTRKAAWLYDQKLPAGEEANMAKFAAAEAGLLALDRAIQTHGGNGMTSEYGIAPLWGMTRLLRTAPVSREMILNFVAQHSLGLPRSY
jgi:alkylation response protein AidB-like acyl-CoA dehydrogenase